MADTRFRPTLFSLDRRDVPASGITPAQVYAAAGFTQQLPGVITYLDEHRDQSKAGGAGAALLSAADQSRANVTVLNNFLSDINEALAFNPAAAEPLGGLAAWASGLLVQANSSATSADQLAAQLGNPRPVPPPPPPTGVGGSQIGSNDDQNPPGSPPVTPSPPAPPPSDGSQLTRTMPNVNDPAFVAVGTQGLKIKDVVVGTGDTATSTSKVTVRYIGFLAADGTSFDNNIGADKQPLAATLGPTPTVIQGFAQGVAGMKVGGIRDIFIPSALGYGAAGAGSSIPPNSNLIFEVQLVSITG